MQEDHCFDIAEETGLFKTLQCAGMVKPKRMV